MIELVKDEEIRRFLIDNGLTAGQMDDKYEEIKIWQKEYQNLIERFWSYLDNRFSAIERRLALLEEQNKG